MSGREPFAFNSTKFLQPLHLGALKTDLWIEHFLSQRALEHVITAELMQTEIAQTVDVLRDAFETRVGSKMRRS